MAYEPGALQALLSLIDAHVPIGGHILDIGSQDIAAATLADLQPIMSRLHGDRAGELISQRFREGELWKVASLFKDSPYRHESIDLYPGEAIIQADLNTFAVSEEYRGAFDLVVNLGSTEHIFDQTNVFRCIHDLAKVGGAFWHSVPVIGYYNHGLYNYHPLFFGSWRGRTNTRSKAPGFRLPTWSTRFRNPWPCMAPSTGPGSSNQVGCWAS